MRRRAIWILLLGAAVLGLLALVVLVTPLRRPIARLVYERAPSSVAAAECRAAPEIVAPSEPWRFALDPADVGAAEGWFRPDFDDIAWAANAPGQPWEEQGYDYDGIGWYRATFVPPAEWGTAYLSLAGVDDRASLWVNGQPAEWESRRGAAAYVVELPVGAPVHVALRVEDTGGPGGIKDPVVLGRQPWMTLAPGLYARWIAARNPEWPMPGWSRNAYYAWTFTGAPNAADEALLASDGGVEPWAAAPRLDLWLYDRGTGALIAPVPTFALVEDQLPIPRARWSALGLTFEGTLVAEPDGTGVRWLVTATNGSTASVDATLLAIVRPLAVNAEMRQIYAAGFDGRDRLWLDGRTFLASTPRPVAVGSGTLASVSEAALRGSVPAGRNVECVPEGDAAASLVFPLTLAPGQISTLAFGMPANPDAGLPDLSQPGRLEAAIAAWREQRREMVVSVPDDRVMAAYRASISYLLVALDPDGPRPGPLAHDALWVRDAAYIGEALIDAGYVDRVRSYLPSLFTHQQESGEVKSVIGPEGPKPVEEWDSQGQAIFLTVNLYRYTDDRALLEEWYPEIKQAAMFIGNLRERTANGPPATQGLLPPSTSAEDLGPPTWHHYWDSFWGVAGLEEAAYAAEVLGHAADAHAMRAEADALRRSIRNSVEAVMGPEPAYIPSAPEDRESSAMARGTAPSLYPVEVIPRTDPLIVRSFEEYHKRWLAPDGGGYRHVYGQWWPYGGLGLARNYLRLGEPDFVHGVLAWTLDHQTLPGVYAWAEQVDPSTGGFSGGDMPHAWAASTYAQLIREMLVLPNGDALELFAGVPESWLTDGRSVALRQAPTPYGPLSLSTRGDLRVQDGSWLGSLAIEIDPSAQPPDGYLWRLSQEPSAVEGPAGAEVRDGWLRIPASGGTVTLRFG